MKKILVIFGTRPEAIKLAPLVIKLKEYSSVFKIRVCVTAQHRELLDAVLNVFGIKPDFDLNIMKKEQGLHDVTSQVLLKIKPILEDFMPDVVLVQGDTTTAMAASLASFYKRIDVGHVEAGLRTYNIYSPWPEEINRQIVTRIAAYHFAPTELNKKNLLKDGIKEESIAVTGNTVIDALFWVVEKIKYDAGLESSLINTISGYGYRFSDKRIILVTGHRRENFGHGFLNICNALKEIAMNNQDVEIIYPVHLNPNVRRPVNDILTSIKNIFLIEPLDYVPFAYLMSRSYIILTDSGGIQEEAPSLGKPVLVMRDTTERPEAVLAGTVKLVGTDKRKIINETLNLLNNCCEYEKMTRVYNPYGDGRASERITEFLLSRQLSKA